MKNTSHNYTSNVVIDLEFTPIPKGRRLEGLRNEIIEIGAVKLAPDGTVCGTFSHMVRPQLASGVSGVVHHITGIGNEDLACARVLSDVLDALTLWIGPGRVRMITWSESDLQQIKAECAAKGIESHLPGRWLDIQRLYPRLMAMNHSRRVALGEAADYLGIENNKSSAHRALYDAQITTEIYRMMATGECAAHRARVEEELSRKKRSCSSSIGTRCDGLAAFLAKLKAQESVATA